ncbi:MAG TPA: hypothetical protein PKU93_01405 [Candidatus Pacearchaeota archaeon]|nr:hypothetical protein [Candidatus Pacearchaeota archaeon]
MKTKGIVSFLFLITFSVFIFCYVSAENNIKLVKDIQIIDKKEVVNLENTNTEDPIGEDQIVVFGNSHGELYLDLKLFLESQNYSFINYSTSSSDFSNKLNQYKKEYKKSEGMSTSFRYYPIIFVKDRAFSGFNEKIKEEIKKTLEENKQ